LEIYEKLGHLVNLNYKEFLDLKTEMTGEAFLLSFCVLVS